MGFSQLTLPWVLHFRIYLGIIVVQKRSHIYIERIAPYSRKSTVIQWEISEKYRGSGSLTFKIELSGNPQGPWELLAENLVDKLVYEDTNFKTSGALKDRYYRVSFQDGSGVSDPKSIFGYMPKKQYLIARKIFNDELVMLKKGNGIKIAVVKRQHWGTRCVCVDPMTKQVMDPDCQICHGTKIEQGYYDPINTWGKLAPAPIGTDYGTQTSVPEIENSQFMLLSFPLVYKDDILVELDINRRWVVVSSQSTELRRNAVHQEVRVSRLPIYHPAYDLDVTSCYHRKLS